MTDETKVYRLMADCPEIQGQRRIDDWQYGDYYYHKNIERTENTQLFFIFTNSRNYLVDNLKHMVWLPDQRQLQEMILGISKWTPLDLIWSCYERNNKEANQIGNTHPCDSMEQLWLSYYMFRKYSKRWTSEKWEPIK